MLHYSYFEFNYICIHFEYGFAIDKLAADELAIDKLVDNDLVGSIIFDICE